MIIVMCSMSQRLQGVADTLAALAQDFLVIPLCFSHQYIEKLVTAA